MAFGLARLRRQGDAADHARRRPRQHRPDRPVGGGLRARDAAVRLHDVDVRLHARPGDAGLQRPEVAGRSRGHVGVDSRRAHPVELLELRQDVRGEGDGDAGKLGGQQLADRPLVRRVGVGVEQADGDGVDLRPPHPLDHAPGRPGLQRRQHLAGVEHALLHLEAEPPGNQRLGPPHPPVVQHRPVLPSDQQHVAEAGGGNQRGARPLPLQQGVDGDGRPVDEEADVGGVEAVAVDEQAHALRDGERLVRRGRRRLGELDPVPLHVVQGEVGEGPSDIDTQPVAHRFSPPVAAPIV